MEPLIGAIVEGEPDRCKTFRISNSYLRNSEERIIEETFEPEYIKVVEGEKEEVTALINASFDYIFFTGSIAVGKIIMRAAAKD